MEKTLRERRGAFFTPAIWADKSKAYLADIFGADWQDEYYIWDCAAGTGNLLAGLQNQYNLWASDIDQPNVDTMHALIDGGLNLLHNHVFQFDFLNDILTLEEENAENEKRAKLKLPLIERKLPLELKKIIDDPEKRRKLIVYINPPYAEAATATATRGTGKNKKNVSNLFSTHDQYSEALGKSIREVFIQFFIRIYFEIRGCKLASFSKLKYINAPNFKNFRNYFKAEFLKGFIIPANTFDNVKGKFPIGFLIWDTGIKKDIKKSAVDVYDEKGNFIAHKTFSSYDNFKTINRWLKNYVCEGAELAAMCCKGTDFQNSNYVNINFNSQLKGIGDAKGITRFIITPKNLIPACVYYSVRHVVPATWLNDRDQFLYPHDAWETDAEFQHNCLVYTLFNNNISCKYGVNHWIPFTEKEAGAKEKFESNFMSSFLKGKAFSEEAQEVLSAGKALWKYFHEKTKNNKTVSVNASFYDIREYFQERKESGAMNVKSADEDYTALLKTLRDALKALAKKIEPKVYEYGFLKA